MKVAVVGTGMFARNNALPGIDMAKGVDLAGVFDINAGAAREAAEAHGVSAFDSLDALIATKPDLVYLSTPPKSHVSLLDTVLDANLNVLCEKPMCTGPEEVEAALAKFEAKGLLHAVDHEWRYTSAYKTLRRMIAAGELGEIRTVSLTVSANYGVVSGWPCYYASFATLLAESGGVIPQVLSHYCDLFEYMFGGLEATGGALATVTPWKPKSASDPTPTFIDAEDSCALSGYLPNGAPVSICASWEAVAPAGTYWIIAGSKQTVMYRTEGLMNGGRLQLVTPTFGFEPVPQEPEYNPDITGEQDNLPYARGLVAAEVEDIAAALGAGRRTGSFATFKDELAVRRNIKTWRATGIRAAKGKA